MDLPTLHKQEMMRPPKHKNTILSVVAVDNADVREIDEQGKPLMTCRKVGKHHGEVIKDGVNIPYHSHYIARLKEGSLLPKDIQTAKLAGVRFTK